ncbi:PREDICTED: interleukin-21 receptor-like [Poecilia mexicana]|uniref:interleukin-21 receptor-like n=1 Tax=Poecilia mexicana TaxID=48701 RepID=UPI00072E0B7C|nr:PREDICTED: interleukin-21 receptor-like [Poecilia mexicana]
MMRGRLLFVLWCFSILEAARSITVSCVSDYITNITCVVNGIDIRPDNCSLKFTFTESNTCPIVATDQGYFCNCKVSDSEMASFYSYDINFCNASSCEVLQSAFKPTLNIKLSPPPAVDLQKSTDYINMTCKSDRYEEHMYFKGILKYEALLQESHGSWNRTVSLTPSKNDYAIPSKALLKQNTEYCVKARFKAEDTSNQHSTWSEWGEPVCWTNEQMTEQEDIVPILLKSLGPACFIIVILLFVFYNPATRMKIKTLGRTPTPAPFFKPLFQQHDGNLQEWLSPHGKYDLTYKTEEDLITDAVTVVPKSSPKDLEENQVFLTSPGTQLVFPLSHTSYVGFPGMEKTSALPYPGDTPYTQLPCSVWSPCVQNVEVVCSDPKGFLEISRSDSGCSCEDLTQSPECSLPCSPVDEIPTPSHCSDYCILNKTAQGVVPVLLSKERPADVPDHSLKSDG